MAALNNGKLQLIYTAYLACMLLRSQLELIYIFLLKIGSNLNPSMAFCWSGREQLNNFILGLPFKQVHRVMC